MDNEYVKYNFSYDLVFKKALELCPKGVVALVKEFIPELKDIDENEEITFLKQQNIIGIDLKTTIFDVNIMFANRYIELEMQRSKPEYAIEARMLKYYADLVSNSFEKSKDTFNYKPTYCLWFLGFELKNDKNVIREYSLYDSKNNKPLLDDSKIIIVEFAKFKKYGYNTNRWYNLFVTNNLNELRGDPVMDELVNSIKNLNNDDDFVLQIDARERAEREYYANINAAKENGINEGIKAGVVEGEKNKTIEIAKKLKEMNLSVEQIIIATGLTKAEIESL